ncbi:FUSC family membrane protein [Pedobacter frigoris]|uniref:FUSC family protein n=1 Tax=Pedobacter frigoris TaxID=2571272 RepID=A0A4U1CT79_9SPHI|nr:FUSC family membrane protein [Pedobacter frigoris]TKC09149.1 FUSC family protein [Pedobacter frigoris]
MQAFLNGCLNFIRREHTGDALRNTFATFVPGFAIVILGGDRNVAIATSVGALLSSLTDLPGIRADKLQSAGWCIPFFFVSAFLTEVVLINPWALTLWLTVAAFACGMLFSLGTRIANVGVLTLILICFTIGLQPDGAFDCSLYIACGALWYFLISIVQSYILPHRSLYYAMKESYSGMATLLRAKADFYGKDIPVVDIYRKISKLHVIVSEQQEHVRSLLLREENLLKSDNSKGRQLLQHAYRVIDLYELLTAIDHDYDHIRQSLDAESSLSPIRKIITLTAELIDALHLPLTKYHKKEQILEASIRLHLAELEQSADTHKSEPGKILKATIRNINEIIEKILSLKALEVIQSLPEPEESVFDYTKFIPEVSIRWSTIRAQLIFKSPVFRFSVRLAMLFGLSAAFGFLIVQAKYSYWLLLTIVIVARPTYAITQRRNYQRIIGTILGLMISMVVLLLLGNKAVLLSIVVVSLFGFFLFNRPNYLVSVLFVTVAVLVSLLTFEGASLELFSSRAVFTLLGTLLALLGWFAIPVRQSKGISGLKDAVVESNTAYFETIKSYLEADQVDLFGIRLDRKKAHISLAAFSEAFHQLQTEPGKKKTDFDRLFDFQALAYRTNSLLIGLSLMIGKSRSIPDFQHSQDRILHLESLLMELKRIAGDHSSAQVS